MPSLPSPASSPRFCGVFRRLGVWGFIDTMAVLPFCRAFSSAARLRAASSSGLSSP